MKILIVEDSLGLIQIYSNIITDILNSIRPDDKAEIIGVVNENEYRYFKNLDFDLAILDWNIVGGTSRCIVEDVYHKVSYSVFITGYAMNNEVLELSEQYNIPVISKPTSDIEIQEILEESIKRIYDKEYFQEKV